MVLLKYLIICVLCTLTCQAYKNYDGYKVYVIYAKNKLQIKFLHRLRETGAHDFWLSTSLVGYPTHVMVSPKEIKHFKKMMRTNHFNFSVHVNHIVPKEIQYRKNLLNVPENGKISFHRFERYSTPISATRLITDTRRRAPTPGRKIVAYLYQLQKQYPRRVKVLQLGKTSESRNLLGVKISTDDKNKPAILIDGGIHAREWISPATVLYIIDQLVKKPSNIQLSKNVDWYIVPCLNPDGYEYSHLNNRFWRKTRSGNDSCKGADANRNFDIHWNEEDTRNDKCSYQYPGQAASSEPEIVGFTKLAKRIKASLKLYITFHSYGKFILYPWSYTSGSPKNKDEIHSLGEIVQSAIKRFSGTKYTLGPVRDTLYSCSGTSIDYMMQVLGVPLAYAIELPPGGTKGFNPPESSILPTVTETFEGLKAFWKYVDQKWKNI